MIPLRVRPDVAAALAEGGPVVALESTIITHGLPHPVNLETALALEAEVRRAGAVPATVAIVAGTPVIGLAEGELEALAREKDAIKCSRRDLPVVVSQRLTGATTVAGTMILARMAGIRLFATGGLGGVHRGAEQTMDISADLTELAATPVAVVCAGAKAILDLGLTLEVLETRGVPVVGYGTDRFPAFYTRDSGHALHARVDTPEAAAALLEAQWALPGAGGVVIANPIAEAHALSSEQVALAVAEAIAEAGRQGVTGKAITPFLLDRMAVLTAGESLKANQALVKANARLAAQIAVVASRAAQGAPDGG